MLCVYLYVLLDVVLKIDNIENRSIFIFFNFLFFVFWLFVLLLILMYL